MTTHPDLAMTPRLGAKKAALPVQVKGPRDNLSQQQRAWLAALALVGLRAEVLKVGTLCCAIVALLHLAASQTAHMHGRTAAMHAVTNNDAVITVVRGVATGSGA